MNKAAESQATLESSLRVMPIASGHNMMLSAEEFPIYHLHLTRFFTELRPQGQGESDLVQRIADNEWRIDRIARLEMGLYARGSIEFAHLFAEWEQSVRSLLVQAHTHSAYAREFNNLSLQEARLRRYVEKDTAELQERQNERFDPEEEAKPMTAAASVSSAVGSKNPNVPAKRVLGFEFSDSTSNDSKRNNLSEHSDYPKSKFTRH